MVEGAAVFVPAIWKLEVVNALVVAERRKKIVPGKSVEFVRGLEQFGIIVDIGGLDHVFRAVMETARRHQRSAYDASYLELARRRGLPFATKDGPLRTAAEESGIDIFIP